MRRAFTLIEVVVSIAIMSILMTAIGSLMVFSARSLPNPDDPTTMTIAAGTAVNRFADDVREALVVTEASTYAFEVEVTDRDGDAAPDTIRYEWSGDAGDPLVRTFNGDRYEILIENVRTMRFEYETQDSDFAPHVLLVVPDPAAMTSAEALRQSLMESWGFTVTTIDEEATAEEFATALLSTTTVYVPEEVMSTTLATKITESYRGVVTEEGRLYDELGISASSLTVSNGEIDITDNTHQITSGLSLGNTRIVSDDGGVFITFGTITADLNVLAEQPSSLNPTLAVLEIGADRAVLGTPSPGRRVKLPWGDTGTFDFDDLTADGLTIMRQSIEWASDHDVVTSVRLTIAGVTDSSTTVPRRVQLVNQPVEPGP